LEEQEEGGAHVSNSLMALNGPIRAPTPAPPPPPLQAAATEIAAAASAAAA